jgi:hypothetical protein
MSDVPPIGIPNLVSQGDLIARTRGAQASAEQVLGEQTAAELHRIGEQRAEQVQESARVEASGRRGRERGQQQPDDPHDRYDHGDDDPDEADEGHRLDVSA